MSTAGGVAADERPRVRVVVADDDATMRSALSALLASEPAFEVVDVAADAREAISSARRHRPDVCVLDVDMPGGGGSRAAREIRLASASSRLVVLSGREDRASVVEMLRAGAMSYVVKGDNVGEILEAVRRAASGQSTLSRGVTNSVVGELADQLASGEHEVHERQQVWDTLAGGRLSMAVQPICDLDSRRAVGYEALARFPDPSKNPPSVCFARAERVGLLLELEMAAVEAALAALPLLPCETFLAINVSPGTVLHPRLKEMVTKDGVGPRIILEVTEHAPIDDYEAVTGALARLRREWVRLAVDDAGAGFASLRHIVRLAPDLIKIDGTLTRDVDTDRTQRALASALITFARETGADIVAEGLETERQVDALRELGVSLGQGYFLGRPEPPATRAT